MARMSRVVFLLLAVLSSVLFQISCTEQVDMSNRYVFNEPTAITYLQKHKETYGIYLELLYKVHVSEMSETTVGQLLSARGHYTIFAPTNEAIQNYLNTLVEKKLIDYASFSAFTDSLKLDSIRKVIVHNSIIDSGDNESWYETSNFPTSAGGEFPLANLNGRKLTVTQKRNDVILINGEYPVNIKNRDIRLLNGVIHQMEAVIAPNTITAMAYLQDIIDSKKGPYLTMARLLQACGLFDTLDAVRDDVYEKLYLRGIIADLPSMTSAGFHEGPKASVPEHRKYGFTIFAETDDFWISQGIDPTADNLMEQVQAWIVRHQQFDSNETYTVDANYENESNLLYQWVTYHVLPLKMPVNKLVVHHSEYGYNIRTRELGVPMAEFHTTMGRRRLMKFYESKASNGVCLNRFPILDNGRKGTYQELSCEPDKVGCHVGTTDSIAVVSDIINCNIYPIDQPLAYTDNVRNWLKRSRMRFDTMSLLPEAINNDIRKKESTEDKYQYVYIPKSSVYQYFDDMWVGDLCHCVYYNAYTYGWPCYHADETKAVGRYEMTFRLPPVPDGGTYELRYGFNATDYRGIVQVYFGEDPDNLHAENIPIDITTNNNCTIRWGYAEDTDDLDFNAEVDKRMRNHGYMKGAMSICRGGNPNGTARNVGGNSDWTIRCILLREYIDPNKTYYLRMRSVLDTEMKEFQIDYLEWCAKEVYDNPEVPEDIW